MKIYKDQESIDFEQKPLFEFNFTEFQYRKWDREMQRRIRKGNSYFIFDVDEAFNCDKMSLKHFKEMIKFLMK